MVPPKERIDAPTFGHGAGMLIKPEVVERAIQEREQLHGKAFKIFFSPQGKKLDQDLLKVIERKARESGHLMLLPARYEGMDARVEKEYADLTVSVGDFVLMGGDIPAMMLIEGMLRLIPGVVGKQESVHEDSFSGPFVDYPEFTEPVTWHGMTVPDVVRSGNHGAIREWRMQQAVKKTVMEHFAWMRAQHMSDEQKKLARVHIPAHYVALMHDQVLADGKEGTTSVMSIDIHDIARSSRTYGINHFFVVTPLGDQQKIVQHFLDFWQQGHGVAYNQNRHNALKHTSIAASLDMAIAAIEEREGKKPILIATSARPVEGRAITFYDQTIVWREQRPVLLIFGTGNGLAPSILERCDYILVPIHGMSDFNHLSVRSAAAVVFDRWLGINEAKIGN